MYTTLTPGQELIVVELRRTLLLPTDDLLAVTREFSNPAVSRAGLGRCLRRYGASDLRDLVAVQEGEAAAKKTFKHYDPSFLHMDIKYLPLLRTKRRAAICSSPSTARPAGSSWKSTRISPTTAAPTSCPG